MKAFNLKALRHTSTELLDLAATESLQTQLERIEIIPYTTIPNAKQGDKIFFHDLTRLLSILLSSAKTNGKKDY